ARRATAPFAVSQAICTWRASANMSGYRRGGQHLDVDFLRRGVGLGLVEDRGKAFQGVDEARRARLVHGDAHRKSLWSGFFGAFILSHQGGTPMAKQDAGAAARLYSPEVALEFFKA